MGSIPLDKIASKVLKMDIDLGDFDRNVELSILLDESIGSAMARAAKIALKPQSDNAIINISTYFDSAIEVEDSTELTIIFSNESLHTSETYALSRAKGIPTVVITESVESLLAAESSCDIVIDEDDILILSDRDLKVPKVNAVVNQATLFGRNVAQGALEVAGKKIPKMITGKALVQENTSFAKPEMEKAIPRYTALFTELGDWICRNCLDARDPLAGCFEFIRESLAKTYTTRTAVENAGTALLFFTVGADFPVMTLNQMKMLVQINRTYGYSISKEMIFEAAAVLAGAFASRGAARLLARSLPNAKVLTNTLIAYFVTALMGHYMNMYCDGGKQIIVKTEFDEDVDEELKESAVGLIDAIASAPASIIAGLKGACEKAGVAVSKAGSAATKAGNAATKAAKNVMPESKTSKFAEPIRITFHADGSVDGMEALEELFISEIGDMEGAR